MKECKSCAYFAQRIKELEQEIKRLSTHIDMLYEHTLTSERLDMIDREIERERKFDLSNIN